VDGFPGRPAELFVIPDSLQKSLCQRFYIRALEGHQVIDALDPAEEASVFGAEVHGTDKTIIH
jgi:predicted transcriptional regulator